MPVAAFFVGWPVVAVITEAWPLFVVVVCCLLFVVCCLLFVVCCLLLLLLLFRACCVVIHFPALDLALVQKACENSSTSPPSPSPPSLIVFWSGCPYRCHRRRVVVENSTQERVCIYKIYIYIYIYIDYI